MQTKQTDYQVVYGGLAKELGQKVAEHIKEGWQVHGSLIYTHGANYYQPMVRVEAVKIKEYMVVEEEYPEDLNKEVLALVQQGWVPLGGIATSSFQREGNFGKETVYNYIQALVKYE